MDWRVIVDKEKGIDYWCDRVQWEDKTENNRRKLLSSDSLTGYGILFRHQTITTERRTRLARYLCVRFPCVTIATLVTQTTSTQFWQLFFFFFFFSAVALPVWHLSRPIFSPCLSRLELKRGASGPYKRRKINLSKNLLDKMTTEERDERENNNMENQKKKNTRI